MNNGWRRAGGVAVAVLLVTAWGCTGRLKSKYTKRRTAEDGFAAAAPGGELEGVTGFVKSRVDVNTPNAVGSTARMDGAAKGRTDVVQVLLARGGEVNRQNDDGWSALHGPS